SEPPCPMNTSKRARLATAQMPFTVIILIIQEMHIRLSTDSSGVSHSVATTTAPPHPAARYGHAGGPACVVHPHHRNAQSPPLPAPWSAQNWPPVGLCRPPPAHVAAVDCGW